MSLEMARRLARQKTAEVLQQPTLRAMGVSTAQAAPSVASLFGPKTAPAATSLNVQPRPGGGFGGLWSAFQQHMQNPANLGMLLGNPMMAPMTKGVLGMTGAPGLFGMTDLLGRGGQNFRTLLQGSGPTAPPA